MTGTVGMTRGATMAAAGSDGRRRCRQHGRRQFSSRFLTRT